MEKKQEEEEKEEDQVGNGQPDDYSFSSTERSSFVLGYRQDRHLLVVGDETTVSYERQPSLHITMIFTLNR